MSYSTCRIHLAPECVVRPVHAEVGLGKDLHGLVAVHVVEAEAPEGDLHLERGASCEPAEEPNGLRGLALRRRVF